MNLKNSCDIAIRYRPWIILILKCYQYFPLDYEILKNIYYLGKYLSKDKLISCFTETRFKRPKFTII